MDDSYYTELIDLGAVEALVRQCEIISQEDNQQPTKIPLFQYFSHAIDTPCILDIAH